METYLKNLVKTKLPDKVYLKLEKIYFHPIFKKLQYFGTTHYCPICRSHLRTMFPYGLNTRFNAHCPVCKSLERHRLIILFLTQKTNLFSPPKKRMLHVAPEEFLTKIFKKSKFINYISTDLEHDAMFKMDLTDIFFPDETFDVIYASHVFEHIVDDRKAMQEIFRILKRTGWAVLQVPLYPGVTIESVAVADLISEERERLLGAKEHVRRYGEDYYDRLREVGFKVHRQRLLLQDNPEETNRLGILPNEEITFCTKG